MQVYFCHIIEAVLNFLGCLDDGTTSKIQWHLGLVHKWWTFHFIAKIQIFAGKWDIHNLSPSTLGSITIFIEFLKLTHHLNPPKSSKLSQLYGKLRFQFFLLKIHIFLIFSTQIGIFPAYFRFFPSFYILSLNCCLDRKMPLIKFSRYFPSTTS